MGEKVEEKGAKGEKQKQMGQLSFIYRYTETSVVDKKERGGLGSMCSSGQGAEELLHHPDRMVFIT